MLRGACGVLAPDEPDTSWSAKPVGCGRVVGVLAPDDEPDRSCNANVVTEGQRSVCSGRCVDMHPAMQRVLVLHSSGC